MMNVEIDSPTFPLIRFIIRGKSRKMKVSQSPLEELRKRPGLVERDSSKFLACEQQTYFGRRFEGREATTGNTSAVRVLENFLLFTKRFHIQEMLDCIVYSSFDVCVIR